jgi:hypothetical protein
MIISLGKSELSKAIVKKDVTWEQIVKKYSTHKVTVVKGGEYVIGGEFSGGVREEAFMLNRTLLVIDIDSYDGHIDELEFDLSLSAFAFVAYSTWRHTPDKPRVRVIVELSRAVTPDEYRVLAKMACESLAVPIAAIDSCSWTPNQPMFAPQHPEGGSFWTMLGKGNTYPVPDFIATPKVEELDDLSAMVAALPLDITDVEVDATLSAYPATGLDYDAWLKCGMALYHQFLGSKVGFARWVAWSKLDAERFDDGEMKAKWKSFGGSDKPVTMASIIYHVKQAGGVVSTAKGWLEQIDACEDKHALEKLVQFKISADKTIGAVDQAGLEIAVKTKFSEFGVVLRADPLRKLFKPKHKRALPDISGSELPLETIGNLRAVADNCNVTIRYNVIKKEDEILIPDAGWSIDNGKTASITWLQSECHKVEMRTANIKNFVTLLADSNQFNPVTEWINSKQWDGISRIDAFYDTVQEDTDKCSAKMKRIVMLRWAVSAIAAAFSPNGIMARGVLVFQGVQYSGKTRWIDALAPKDMELIKTGRALNVHDKDSVKQIVSSWISELGELDATFKKSDIAALKAFITSDTDELRRPYAAAESRYARRTVFAASVNESKFLQDDTGNSRFWVIPIVSINHAHELDMQQVWAEFYVLWKGGEKHYLTNSEMTMLNGHNESFTAPEPIFEMVSSHLDWANFDPNDCHWMQTSDVLRWIGKENPSKFETIVGGRAIQKMNGGMQRKSHGKLLSAVPNEKLSIEVHNFDKIGANSSEGVYGPIPF